MRVAVPFFSVSGVVPFREGWRAAFSLHANPHRMASSWFFPVSVSCHSVRVGVTSLHFTSILITSTGPGAQNRYFSKGFYIKNDTFSVPAAPGRSLRDAPALETVDFLNDFNKKSILFQSRPILAARSRKPRHSKPLIFLMILIRNRYFFNPGRSWPLAPGRPGSRNR